MEWLETAVDDRYGHTEPRRRYKRHKLDEISKHNKALPQADRDGVPQSRTTQVGSSTDSGGSSVSLKYMEAKEDEVLEDLL